MSSDNQELIYSTLKPAQTPQSVIDKLARQKLESIGYVWCETKREFVFKATKRMIDGVWYGMD